MKQFIFALITASFAAPLMAQEITDCDWRASSMALMEPWEEYSVTFSNGAVRLAQLDTIEPAAGAFHLLILSPPFDEIGERQCKVLSADLGGMGFEALDITAMDADYDPATGLLFQMPARIFEGEIAAAMGRLTVALNQSTGEIAALYEAPQ